MSDELIAERGEAISVAGEGPHLGGRRHVLVARRGKGNAIRSKKKKKGRHSSTNGGLDFQGAEKRGRSTKGKRRSGNARNPREGHFTEKKKTLPGVITGP